jgi:hypothetical protein
VTSLDSPLITARWRKEIVRAIARYHTADYSESLILLQPRAIIAIADVEHGTEQRRLRFGPSKIE